MKPKDIFSLAIRLVGLFFVYLAARNVPMIMSSSGDAGAVTFLAVLYYGAVAWWLIGGAPLLMERAYPEPTQNEKSGAASAGEKSDA